MKKFLLMVVASLAMSMVTYAAGDAVRGNKALQSQLSGKLQHFAPQGERGAYEISADSKGNVKITVTANEEDINYIQLDVVDQPTVMPVIANDKKSASYTFKSVAVGSEFYFRFVYGFGEMIGNEMTALELSKTDENIFYYVYEGSTGEEVEGGEEEEEEPKGPESQLNGVLQHFAPQGEKGTYEISADDQGNVTITVRGSGNDINYIQLDVVDQPTVMPVIANDKRSASYTFTSVAVGSEFYFRFIYGFGEMIGNEMTALELSKTDANIFYYVYEGSTEKPVEAPEEEPKEEDPEQNPEEGGIGTSVETVNVDGVAVVYDITGKVVKSNVDAKSAIEGLNRGIYIVKTSTTVKKVIVR